MVERNEIIRFINEFLSVSEFDDYCVNGLQVEGKSEINKIICGVSVSQRFFQQAIARQADMIIVHHGIFWKNDPSPFALTGFLKERLAMLLKNDINLLAYHLPLDAHPEIGNNAQILKRLGITPIQPVDVGFLGELDSSIDITSFVKKVNSKLETNAQTFLYGPDEVQRVLVISGASAISYKLAIEYQADTFLGGDIRENIVRELEETGINYINAGHYNTERFGIQALCKVIAKQFSLACDYIDIPNPV